MTPVLIESITYFWHATFLIRVWRQETDFSARDNANADLRGAIHNLPDTTSDCPDGMKIILKTLLAMDRVTRAEVVDRHFSGFIAYNSAAI